MKVLLGSVFRGLILVGVAFGLIVSTASAQDLLENQLVVEKQQFEPGSFENPGKCLSCHIDIHDQWSKSMHAYAWTNKFYRNDYQLAHDETAGATDVLCGACHAPIAARTGQLPPHDGSQFDATSQQGISCDFCHTVTDIERPFNMGHVSDPGAIKYGPRDDGQSPYHEIEFKEHYKSAEFCGSCHNVRHPVNDVSIIDTYDDWLSGPYAEQGIVCQDCHMTPTPGIGENPGKSSPIGLERDHVATHTFIGGSVFSQRQMGNEAQAQLAEEMLRAAVELSLESSVDQGQLALTIHVDNVGAGHKIPTGVTYIRKMWLEVQVKDAAGKPVFTSGLVDEENHVDPDAVFYRLLFKDADGNLTGKSWRAVGIGYDRRIPAQGRDSETYEIPLSSAGSYRAEVRLMYRSFSQETLDFHEGENAPDIESVEMARAEVNIQI